VKQAVTLGGYPKGIWMTLTDPAGLAVLLEHTPSAIPQEACLFNMWVDAEAGYFSPEPWVGMQNSFVSGDGLIKLKPGGEWRWRLKLSYLDLTRNRGRELPAR
jgi:galactose mutarotase-like enzyme